MAIKRYDPRPGMKVLSLNIGDPGAFGALTAFSGVMRAMVEANAAEEKIARSVRGDSQSTKGSAAPNWNGPGK